jgi:transposase
VEAKKLLQLHHDRWALTINRNRHKNRIKGLLATQGSAVPSTGIYPKNSSMFTNLMVATPMMLRSRLIREHARLQLMGRQINAIEQEQRHAIRRPEHLSRAIVRDLVRLKIIHINTS